MFEKKHYKGKVSRREKYTKTIIFNGNNEPAFDSLVYSNYNKN
jgi:hypothetical protein